MLIWTGTECEDILLLEKKKKKKRISWRLSVLASACLPQKGVRPGGEKTQDPRQQSVFILIGLRWVPF